MAKRATPKQGKFMIVSHAEAGFRIYSSVINGRDESLVVPPGVEIVADKAWADAPTFARDVQQGRLLLRYADVLPPARIEMSGEAYTLDPGQRGLARTIASTDWPFPQHVAEAVQIHKLLRPGGVTPDNVKVTRDYCKKSHRVTLLAAADFERQQPKPRQPVLDFLAQTVSEIEAL